LLVIPDNIDSKYRFVVLSALRARQIQSGSPTMVEELGRKSTTVARQELVEGLIQFSVPEKENLFQK
jgi:DNA-directed RNA polymerase omega subunit